MAAKAIRATIASSESVAAVTIGQSSTSRDYFSERAIRFPSFTPLTTRTALALSEVSARTMSSVSIR